MYFLSDKEWIHLQRLSKNKYTKIPASIIGPLLFVTPVYILNRGPAGPGYALPLQTNVDPWICTVCICISHLDKIIWLVEN